MKKTVSLVLIVSFIPTGDSIHAGLDEAYKIRKQLLRIPRLLYGPGLEV
ncbi:hypothetical protein KZ483_20720 [Paenibacillus sp. sptzw28]|nr:hypothetical protein [Paenibacillus sp. sptzw28]QYR20238.1 hypothetical protein KZ483_20720 [Paenibacillus sp. sptzw28]